MKKEDQKMYIRFPADPQAPALVKLTQGPLAREAERLAETPESGWESAPSDNEGILAFFVDPKLLRPHPKRKPRPDAAGHLAKYREEKKSNSDSQPEDPPTQAPAEPEAAEDQTPTDPNDPWGGFVF